MRNNLTSLSRLYLISFLFVGLMHPVLGQEIFTLKGQLVDIISKEPVEGVHILVDGENLGTIADNEGFFAVQTNQKSVELSFSHIAYQTNTLRFSLVENQKPIVILLTPKSYELSEAIISSKRQYKYSVMDFNFIDSSILILAKRHRDNAHLLFLLDESFDTLARMTDLPDGKLPELSKDCMGNCHLLFKDTAYQVFYVNRELILEHPVSTKKFHQLMDNCLFETSLYLVFRKNSSNEYLTEYFAVNKENYHTTDFISSFDAENMNALNDEMKFIQRNPQAFTSTAGKSLAIAYAKEIAFKPSMSYLDKVGDSIYYFDHGNDKLMVYTDLLELSREITFSYHKNKNWRAEVKIDKQDHRVYGVFDNGSKIALHEINLLNGTSSIKQLIPLVYPEKLKINNGYIYFLYKERGNVWAKKELYRLKI